MSIREKVSGGAGTALAAALLMIGSAVHAAPDAPPGGTIAYVITGMSWALHNTPELSECPQGLNDGTREQFKKLFPPDGTRRSFESTQMRREIEGLHPTAAPDLLEFREGQGPVAPGIDLDGVAGAEDFNRSDGTPGIDNQMHRVLGCIANYRAPDGPIRFFEDEMILRENYNRLIVELQGVDSLADDDEVRVRIFRGRDKVLVDAGGLKAVPGGTQRVDLRYGADYLRETRGSIAGGVLRTEPQDLRYPWNAFYFPSDQYMYEASFELALTPVAASGILGGFVDIETWYLHMIRNWSSHYQSYGKSSGPSIYKAMQRLADAEPQPQAGRGRAISGALAVVFTQVNLILPDAAEYATALARRRMEVPYRGMPAPRPAEEEAAATGAANLQRVSVH